MRRESIFGVGESLRPSPKAPQQSPVELAVLPEQSGLNLRVCIGRRCIRLSDLWRRLHGGMKPLHRLSGRSIAFVILERAQPWYHRRETHERRDPRFSAEPSAD
jgi:hypothetical protein